MWTSCWHFTPVLLSVCVEYVTDMKGIQITDEGQFFSWAFSFSLVTLLTDLICLDFDLDRQRWFTVAVTRTDFRDKMTRQVGPDWRWSGREQTVGQQQEAKKRCLERDYFHIYSVNWGFSSTKPEVSVCVCNELIKQLSSSWFGKTEKL